MADLLIHCGLQYHPCGWDLEKSHANMAENSCAEMDLRSMSIPMLDLVRRYLGFSPLTSMGRAKSEVPLHI